MPNNHKAAHATFINHLNDNHLAIQSIWQYFRGPSLMNKAKENTKEVSMLFWPKDNRLVFLTLKRIHSGTATAESVISFVLSAPEDQRLSCTLAYKSESWKICHFIHFSSKSFLLHKLIREVWIFFACRLMVPFLHIQIVFPFCPSLGSKFHSSEGPTFKTIYKYW